MGGGQKAVSSGRESSIDVAALTRRRLLAAAGNLALGLIVPGGLLIAWIIAALLGRLPEQILPPPWVVLDTLSQSMQDGTLLSNTVTSLRRVGEGFGAGALAETRLQRWRPEISR